MDTINIDSLLDMNHSYFEEVRKDQINMRYEPHDLDTSYESDKIVSTETRNSV